MVRAIARKNYRNGRFGEQSASLSYDDGLMEDGFRVGPPRWVVADHDRFAYQTLTDAKAHYRRIGGAA